MLCGEFVVKMLVDQDDGCFLPGLTASTYLFCDVGSILFFVNRRAAEAAYADFHGTLLILLASALEQVFGEF